jgi:hypothetical protein
MQMTELLASRRPSRLDIESKRIGLR